jgi:hypothetical protein
VDQGDSGEDKGERQMLFDKKEGIKGLGSLLTLMPTLMS